MCYLKENELGEVRNDLDVLTRDHQNLTQQIMVTREESNKLKQAKDGLMSSFNQNQQLLRQKEFDKSDILAQYKDCCLKNERLQKNVQELVQENEMMFNRQREMEKEFQMQSSRIQGKDQRENELLQEVHSYQRQIQVINRSLEQAEISVKQQTMAKQSML